MRIVNSNAVAPTTGIPLEAVPEIGRIGMGKKEKTEKGFDRPDGTDYFVPRGEATETFVERFGATPTRIPIYFFNDSEEASCSVRLEIRDRRGDLFAYSDGESYFFRHKHDATNFQPGFTKVVTKTRHPDIEQKTIESLTRGMTADKAKYIEWKQTMYLTFMIRDFPRTGCFKLSTHGANSSIPQVVKMVDTWKSLIGRLCLVPFDLVIKQAKTRENKIFTFINLEPAFSIEKALQFSRNRPQLNGASTLGLAQLTLIETLTARDDLAEHSQQLALDAVVDENPESLKVIEEGVAETV